VTKLDKQLLALNACDDSREWARGKTLAVAWRTCHRADWMLWLASRAEVPRQALVLAACACARTSLQYVKQGEERPLRAIEAAEDWARGGLTTLEQVRTAAYAAYAATYDAYAADAAYAAYDAAYAAYAADAYAPIDAAREASATAAHAAGAYAAYAATYDAYAADAAREASAAYAATYRSKALRSMAALVRKLIPYSMIAKAMKGGTK